MTMVGREVTAMPCEGRPMMMRNRIGNIQAGVPIESQAKARINVFQVTEKILIEAPNRQEGLASVKGCCPTRGKGRVLTQESVSCALAEASTKRTSPGGQAITGSVECRSADGFHIVGRQSWISLAGTEPFSSDSPTNPARGRRPG